MRICNFENVGNFQKNVQEWHSGSHAIAWATITTSVHSGFLRPSKLRRGIVSSTLRDFHKIEAKRND